MKIFETNCIKSIPFNGKKYVLLLYVFLSASLLPLAAQEQTEEQTERNQPVFRIGIVGATTSHVPAAVEYFNNPEATGPAAHQEITALWRGGMPDNPSSWDRRHLYADECSKLGIKIYDSLDKLLQNVDGVMVESVDGRCHLELVKKIIAAKKPVFVDKPLAGCLADVLAIERLAEETNIPIFSASSLRYATNLQKMVTERPLGEIRGCDASGPAPNQEVHPDLYWYGIHAVESLFTVLGPDCLQISCVKSDSTVFVTGLWSNGQIGTMRGTRQGGYPWHTIVFGEKEIRDVGGYGGYNVLFEQVSQLFETGISPLPMHETVMIHAFMSSADTSWENNGAPVTLSDVIKSAENEKSVTISITLNEQGIQYSLDTPEQGTEPVAITSDELKSQIQQLKTTNDRVRILLDNRGASEASLKAFLPAIRDAYLARFTDAEATL